MKNEVFVLAIIFISVFSIVSIVSAQISQICCDISGFRTTEESPDACAKKAKATGSPPTSYTQGSCESEAAASASYEYSCTDTDNGKIIGTQGIVTVIRPYDPSLSASYGDKCKGKILTEYYCSGNDVGSEEFDCSLLGGCYSGACQPDPNQPKIETKEKRTECKDTDGSKKKSAGDFGIYEVGSASGENIKGDVETISDKCIGTAGVQEAYCIDETLVGSTYYPCKNSCEKNACKTGCEDTDGLDIFVGGVVTTGNKKEVDACANGKYTEYVCNKENLEKKDGDCPKLGDKTGECATSSACKKPEATPQPKPVDITCTDTDGGKNEFVAGEAYETKNKVAEKPLKDYCAGGFIDNYAKDPAKLSDLKKELAKVSGSEKLDEEKQLEQIKRDIESNERDKTVNEEYKKTLETAMNKALVDKSRQSEEFKDAEAEFKKSEKAVQELIESRSELDAKKTELETNAQNIKSSQKPKEKILEEIKALKSRGGITNGIVEMYCDKNRRWFDNIGCAYGCIQSEGRCVKDQEEAEKLGGYRTDEEIGKAKPAVAPTATEKAGEKQAQPENKPTAAPVQSPLLEKVIEKATDKTAVLISNAVFAQLPEETQKVAIENLKKSLTKITSVAAMAVFSMAKLGFMLVPESKEGNSIVSNLFPFTFSDAHKLFQKYPELLNAFLKSRKTGTIPLMDLYYETPLGSLPIPYKILEEYFLLREQEILGNLQSTGVKVLGD